MLQLVNQGNVNPRFDADRDVAILPSLPFLCSRQHEFLLCRGCSNLLNIQKAKAHRIIHPIWSSNHFKVLGLRKIPTAAQVQASLVWWLALKRGQVQKQNLFRSSNLCAQHLVFPCLTLLDLSRAFLSLLSLPLHNLASLLKSPSVEAVLLEQKIVARNQ